MGLLTTCVISMQKQSVQENQTSNLIQQNKIHTSLLITPNLVLNKTKLQGVKIGRKKQLMSETDKPCTKMQQTQTVLLELHCVPVIAKHPKHLKSAASRKVQLHHC